VTDHFFSPVPPVSSTNKINRHNITEILLLKVALNTIKQTNKQTNKQTIVQLVLSLYEPNNFAHIVPSRFFRTK
jgi:hypothetical protein